MKWFAVVIVALSSAAACSLVTPLDDLGGGAADSSSEANDAGTCDADTKGDPHNCGALYSRIMPSENVSKPPGQWQTFDITLVDRHLTVIHNGKKTIDNQPVLGCTGGALWSDEFRPGPIYLQGDHTSVDYRNMVLRPVVK